MTRERCRCPQCGRDIVVSPTGVFVVHWTKPPRRMSVEHQGVTFVPCGKLCEGSCRAPEAAKEEKGIDDEHV